MISICTTIYNQPENLEVFVRSMVGNATDKNFEIVIVDDENSCTKKLKELSKEFPQIKRISRSKKQRIKFIQGLIKFYKEIGIFEPEIIKGMEQTLSDYIKKNMRLWLPMPHNFNLAAKYAKGDTLVFLPADYLIFFDISKLKTDYGHFEWIDITSVEPYPDFKTVNIDELLGMAIKQKVGIVQGQHGARIVSKELFDEIGGFDDRWFVRALGEDLFNDKCRAKLGWRRLADTHLYLTPPYVGCIRGNKDFVYLSPKYDSSVDKHHYFVDKIKVWIG